MQNDLRQLLVNGAKKLSVDVSENQLDQLLDYLALLVKWNNAYNLTAIREPEKMVTLHLLDSLTLVPYFTQFKECNLLDVGTGAGLPGIVLAIMRPDNCYALLDSNGKKTRFLFQVKTQLGLSHVDVHHCRVEDLDKPNYFQVITSRAFATLKDMVDGSHHLLADNGRYLAMKGQYPDQELKELPDVVVVDRCERLSLPGDAAERHLVVLSKKT